MGDQIGITGQAGSWGIPATTVTWDTTHNMGPLSAMVGATAHSLTIFSEVTKTPDADIDPAVDNSGERLGHNRRNKRIGLRFSAHPKGANAAAAQAIAAALPNKGDALGIVCATDLQVACDGTTDTILVDECSSRYTPEGELVVDFTATKWLGKIFVALT
jgi:hypothetical protein